MNIGLPVAGTHLEPTDSLQLGWIALILPIAVGVCSLIARAFMAESRVSRDCEEQITSVRDRVLSENVRPILATLVINVYPYVQPYMVFSNIKALKGEPGDPEFETRRVLGSNPSLYDFYSGLEGQYGSIHEAKSVLARRVGHAQRMGVASFVFLLSWVYVGFLLCMPKIEFPAPITVFSILLLGLAVGWMGAEFLGSVREGNRLAVLARQAQVAGGSTR